MVHLSREDVKDFFQDLFHREESPGERFTLFIPKWGSIFLVVGHLVWLLALICLGIALLLYWLFGGF